MRVDKVLLPKRGCSPRECEDAAAVNLSAYRFAVADGATEAFDSRRWARYLVTAWVGDGCGAFQPDDYLRELRALGDRWAARWEGHDLPWYIEAKRASGSYAAFLGLQLQPTGDRGGTWRAIAAGDCCLVVEQTLELARSFPQVDACQFGNRPVLVPSAPGDLRADAIVTTEGSYDHRTLFLMMSDAIAAWYLSRASVSPDLRSALHQGLNDVTRGNMCSFLERERLEGHLHNDDVVILRVQPVD